MQNTKKVQGGETKRKKKDEPSGTYHAVKKDESFGTYHESSTCRIHDGALSWKDCSDNKSNKQRNNTERRKQKSLKNRKKLQSTPCLIQITKGHQLPKSKTTLNMMRTMTSQKI
jgi:hypothetical protein